MVGPLRPDEGSGNISIPQASSHSSSPLTRTCDRGTHHVGRSVTSGRRTFHSRRVLGRTETTRRPRLQIFLTSLLGRLVDRGVTLLHYQFTVSHYDTIPRPLLSPRTDHLIFTKVIFRKNESGVRLHTFRMSFESVVSYVCDEERKSGWRETRPRTRVDTISDSICFIPTVNETRRSRFAGMCRSPVNED